MTEQLRLMAVHAHPDDESSKGAATMAKYVSEGVDVLVVTCTGGERGSILNPKLQGDPYIEENIHEVRRKEMDEAREILGVKQEWLGFVDSGLPEGDPLPPLPQGCFALEDVDKAAGRLVKSIRAFRPQVITTYDENGGYPHPDHIMTHKITMVAFEGATDAEKYPEQEFGPVWQPLKVYYNQGFNRPRTEAPAPGTPRPGPGVAVRGVAEALGRVRARRAHPHHLRAVRRLLRDPGPGADRAPHPDRPRRRLVPRADGDPEGGLAHRGVRARHVPRRHVPPRGRPLRGYPRQCMT